MEVISLLSKVTGRVQDKSKLTAFSASKSNLQPSNNSISTITKQITLFSVLKSGEAQ